MYEKILSRKIDYTLLDYASPKQIPPARELFLEFDGISITSPYKEHFLKEVNVEKSVLDLKAINCLKKNEDATISGTNTDYLALKEILLSHKNKNFVLLGSGAMYRVCSKVLNEEGIAFEHFSRGKDGDITKLEFTDKKNQIIINTCSRDYVFQGKMNSDNLFYDLNYNFKPHQELFNHLKSSYIDGLPLLELQARYALKFWGIN